LTGNDDPFLPSQEEKDAAQRLLMTLDAQKHCVWAKVATHYEMQGFLQSISGIVPTDD